MQNFVYQTCKYSRDDLDVFFDIMIQDTLLD